MPKITQEQLEAMIDERAKRAAIELLKKMPGDGPEPVPGAESRPQVLDSDIFDDDGEDGFVGSSGFKGLLDFCRTVAYSPGDDRLVKAEKAMEAGSPEYGGYLVPIEFQNILIKESTRRLNCYSKSHNTLKLTHRTINMCRRQSTRCISCSISKIPYN